MFNVGDHVISRHFGRGVVARITDPKQSQYPVGVRFNGGLHNAVLAYAWFTLDGHFHTQFPNPEYDIILEE